MLQMAGAASGFPCATSQPWGHRALFLSQPWLLFRPETGEWGAHTHSEVATAQHPPEGGILGRQHRDLHHCPGVLAEVRDGCQMRPGRQGQAGQTLAARDDFLGPSRVAAHQVGICLLWWGRVCPLPPTPAPTEVEASAASPACREGCTSFSCLITMPAAARACSSFPCLR